MMHMRYGGKNILSDSVYEHPHGPHERRFRNSGRAQNFATVSPRLANKVWAHMERLRRHGELHALRRIPLRLPTGASSPSLRTA